jgi:hypothetical protein
MFPRAINRLPLQILVYLCLLAGAATAGVSYYMTPKYTRVGYAPVQPVPYSHAKHVGELGLDCRYCHSTIDTAGSALPTAQTCMNCHSEITNSSPALAAVRESFQSGAPIRWVHVNVMPSFVYFDHAVHVNRGVGCAECHGNVSKMEVVTQVQPMSMGFCLDCHRAPQGRLREKRDIFKPGSPTIEARKGAEAARQFARDLNLRPTLDCSGCHR